MCVFIYEYHLRFLALYHTKQSLYHPNLNIIIQTTFQHISEFFVFQQPSDYVDCSRQEK